MPATIINGHKIADRIKDEIVKEIIRENGGKGDLSQDKAKADKRPNLAIILVGEREDSNTYVNLKEKEAKKVGVDTHLYKLPEDTGEEEIKKVIRHLNKDDLIDAILIQLPLPGQINTDEIIKTLDPNKDLDRFHPENIKIIQETCDHDHVLPPVFQVVFEVLKEAEFELVGKQVCIVANSDIFGSSLARALECYSATAEVVSPEAKDLSNKTSQADLLITAAGQPHLIKKDMIKKNAGIIDIGITKKGKKIWGDVDQEDVSDKASFLTPVPGGVGPITIATALKNTLELFKRKN